jgi:hypothetical protein
VRDQEEITRVIIERNYCFCKKSRAVTHAPHIVSYRFLTRRTLNYQPVCIEFGRNVADVPLDAVLARAKDLQTRLVF